MCAKRHSVLFLLCKTFQTRTMTVLNPRATNQISSKIHYLFDKNRQDV